MNSEFELPIFYLENKEKLDSNIINDLELLALNEETEEYDRVSNNDNDNIKNDNNSDTSKEKGIDQENQDKTNRKCLMETVIQPKSKIGKERLHKLCEYYTNNKLFLKQTQKIIGSWKLDDNPFSKQKQYDKFYELWQNIKGDEKFIDRYYYVDVDFFKFLNHSSPFLQLLSIYNLVSPILSLILPVILLLVPFFMLKFSGIPITLESYYKVLMNIFSKHALGNIFTIMEDISWEKRIYAVVSVVFYVFSIYQNSIVCYRFYKNFKSIHEDLFLLRDYLTTSIENMNKLELACMKHNTYLPFVQSIYPHKEYCTKLLNELNVITDFDVTKLHTKSRQIGYIMKYFYEFHINKDIQSTIEFSIGMNSFVEHMNGLNKLSREKFINKCKFGKKTKMKRAYYPCLMFNETVKNDIDLSKNMAITGPNASGKTTILKTVLFNLIFSQGFGYGFYSNATISPYNHIHCYLNIPDTSGRDSLFQAEARRCKEILESLEDGNKHFCIFDELFSGTNPTEACASSYGFVKYLIEQKNIDFILTTHLMDLCKKLEHVVNNSHMNVEKQDEYTFKYTYQINRGISNVRGGLKVLFDLNYPECILAESTKLLETM
jgi:hypothetical protein